jgi:hypothetical protein
MAHLDANADRRIPDLLEHRRAGRKHRTSPNLCGPDLAHFVALQKK